MRRGINLFKFLSTIIYYCYAIYYILHNTCIVCLWYIIQGTHMIHQYARHTNYNDSGDKCYKNIQKVQEKRQLQQTTELCITGLWTGAGVWQTVHYLLPSWGQAGPKQSGQEGWLLQDTGYLTLRICGALLSAAVVPTISVPCRYCRCAFSSYIFTSSGSVHGKCKTELLLTARCLLSTALCTGARWHDDRRCTAGGHRYLTSCPPISK